MPTRASETGGHGRLAIIRYLLKWEPCDTKVRHPYDFLAAFQGIPLTSQKTDYDAPMQPVLTTNKVVLKGKHRVWAEIPSYKSNNKAAGCKGRIERGLGLDIPKRGLQ